ncbi:hypothetical protein QOT17_021321 [Balamuthia mandrillaris]
MVMMACMPQQASGWGTQGHQIVAELAERLILPSTKHALQPYLGGSALHEIACLPDGFDHTRQGLWSFGNHFSDMIPHAVRWRPELCPLPKSCVVRAIANYTKLLMEEEPAACKLESRSEPCPLSFLTHYVGDIHQPLHVGYAKDKGGNLHKVHFFGRSSDLHTVWDSLLLLRYLQNHDHLGEEVDVDDVLADQILLDEGEFDADELLENEVKQRRQHWMYFVAELELEVAQNPQLVIDISSQLSIEEWADESFNVTRFQVYQFKESVVGKNEEYEENHYQTEGEADELTEWYFQRNIKTVKSRLLAAGIRLAALLDHIFSRPNQQASSLLSTA